MTSRRFTGISLCALLIAIGYIVHLQHAYSKLEARQRQSRRRLSDVEGRLSLLAHFDQRLRILTDLKPSHPGTESATQLFEKPSLYDDDDVWGNSMINSRFDGLREEVDRQLVSLSNLVDYFGEQKLRLSTTPSIWPSTGWITSHFGPRLDPFTGSPAMHTGLDIAAPHGTKVVAPAAGSVIFAGDNGTFGNLVTIDHGQGLVTQYGHLSKPLVQIGDKVKRGDAIALVGSTGRCTGPHLHYEVRKDGIPINPRPYIVD